jgi:NitT/TauT family transport system substrate-binding protein
MTSPLALLRLGIVALLFAAPGGCGGGADHDPSRDRLLRVGHFPNVTHGHGVVGHALTRAGRGWFEERLGVKVEWYVYNAGPSAMEALLAGSIDMTYVGPNPALNAFVRSEGEILRVVSGATRGGSGLVVREGVEGPESLRGLVVATPQFGNTQDVACRAWLIEHGYEITQTGGDVHVVPTANPDQLTLFQKGDLAGAWTVEPWVSRIELEAAGRLLVEEKDVPTTVLVASTKTLATSRELVRKWIDAQRELTAWMAANPAETKALVRDELAAETSKPIGDALLDRCWGRLSYTNDITVEEFQSFARAAHATGFLPKVPDLAKLVEVP